ncbi:MAG: membrane protein insertion efficiency factor YidD [Rickettsiaceae bacterium]|nr:MAG: membrane protein insertion efficiency factor YidD [Rickettsiaceae bacterium]
MQKLLIKLIKLYQLLVSPYLGQNCRFYPTCSQYAIESVSYHGIIKGGMYAIYRILRCQPLSKGGVDEVKSNNGSISDS